MIYSTNFNPTSNQLVYNEPDNTEISVNPNLQDRIIEQLLLQSGGIAVGFVLAFVGAIYASKLLGVGSLLTKMSDNFTSGTDSLRTLAEALKSITLDLKDNHSTYIKDHAEILDAVVEVKDLVKDISRKLDK